MRNVLISSHLVADEETVKPLGCWAHWRKGVTAVGRLLQFYIPSALRPFSASWFTGMWQVSDTCFHAFISTKDRISWNPGAKLKPSSLMLLFLRVLGHSNEKNDLIQYNYKLHLHNILKFKMSTTHLIWILIVLKVSIFFLFMWGNHEIRNAT